ncbi:MAG: serine/threonine-protein kinase [Synechococcus sp.]|nr:serine/threonine-protein kinase [Synechococcus sp.]
MQSSLINGRYQIVKTLGQGGFGDTFLVKDLQLPSQRQCVLKSLKVSATNPQTVQEMQRRFQREAAILEGLGEKHNQIPKLYAYFEEQGRFYLVQEWIDGLTLQDIVKQQGSLTPGQVQQILVDLLPVLQLVHDQYIIHRDIKPENIILRASDRKPVLIDFGAVKEALTTAIHLDLSQPVSVAIGTPGYMAPEQGTGRPVYSSDLYGLGFTAIFLLTGQSPQQFPNDPQTGELIWQQDFPYLQIPLGQVIAKAVKFHPRDRFPTARAMLNALQGATMPLPVPTVNGHHSNHTTATRVVGKPPAPRRTGLSTTTATMADFPETENGGCWRLAILTVLFSAIGISAGIWLTFAFLGRSPQPQTFPEDPALNTEVDPTPIDLTPAPELLPELEPEPQPEPLPELEPEPEPEPQPTPEPNPETPPDSPPEASDIPNIPVGTPADVIPEVIPVPPTSQSRGFWGNSTAILYRNYGGTKVSLGYIVDNNTGRLAQTEVTFPPETALSVIQQTLSGLLPDGGSPEARQALENVYRRNSSAQSFRTSNYRGQIKRNEGDRLYVAIWNPAFHD